jgi:hypothetical protein
MLAQKFLHTCKHHWPALVVALLASIYVVLPGIVSSMAAGAAYDGVYASSNGDWLYYASRISKISEGHSGGNQYLFEHAEDMNVNTPGAEVALAAIVRTFHINTISLLIALNAIMPFLITLIFYALLYRLSRSRWVAAAIPLFLIVTNIWNLSKAIHPQINLPILLSLLFVWLGMLSRLENRDVTIPLSATLRKMWKGILFCGVLLGMLYFIYLYDWSFLYVVFGCSILLALVYRQRDVAALNALILAASAPFAVGYAVLLRRVFQSPLTAELAPRYGAYHTHLPESIPKSFVALVAVVLLVLLLRYAKVNKQRVALGVLCLVAANLIYPNYQIVLGVVYNTSTHWSFMPIVILSIASAFAFSFVKNPPPNAPRRVIICAIGIIVLFVVASLRLSYFIFAPPVTETATQDFISAQRYGPILRYLQTSTPPDTVILTDDRLSYFIPAFTHNFVYYLNYIQNTPASDREVAERYLLSSQFDPTILSDQDLGIGPRPRRNILWEAPYHIEATPLYRLLYGVRESPYSSNNEIKFAKEVKKDLEASGGITVERLKKYRIDYVIWDKKLHPDWTIPNVKQFEQIFERNDLIIYRVAI